MSDLTDPDGKILTYGDIILRRSDLQILRSPSFINDRLIHFYFTHLTSNIQKPLRLLLLPPSISFFLSNSPSNSSLVEFSAPLLLHSRDLILFPVNDNIDPSVAEGGAHWSLLVYDKADNLFVHHDSCDGMNHPHARHLYDAVRGFFGRDPGFVAGDTWQQRNGYDCGVYVMAAARVICDWFENGKEGDEKWFKRLRIEVDDGAVGRLRGEVLDLIVRLGGRE